MAELLLMNKPSPNILMGSIIEYHEDGHWTVDREGFQYPTFLLLLASGLPVETIDLFQKSVVNNYAYRFRVRTELLDFDENGICTVSRLRDAQLWDNETEEWIRNVGDIQEIVNEKKVAKQAEWDARQ